MLKYMILGDLLSKWQTKAQTVWAPELAYREMRRLAAHLLKKEEIWVLTHPEAILSPKELKALNQALKQFSSGQPVAQIIHSAPFFGRTFFVNRFTLIPRIETELLVKEALQYTNKETLVIEVGTGSGCIAITLSGEAPKTVIFASEISKQALLVARKNAKTLLTRSPIHFFQGSLLHTPLQRKISSHPAKQLVFLANLPYLPESDQHKLHPSVTQFEPKKALYAKNAGLALIEQFLKQIKRFSQKDSRSFVVLCEFDPPQALTLKKISTALFPLSTISIKKDEYGRPRLLSIYCPKPANT